MQGHLVHLHCRCSAGEAIECYNHLNPPTCALLGPALGLEGARKPNRACVCTERRGCATAWRGRAERGARLAMDCAADSITSQLTRTGEGAGKRRW